MRRTLTVLVASAALLVPATAASAAPPNGFSNASCNNGKGGNGATYNLRGNVAAVEASGLCGGAGDVDPPFEKPAEPIVLG